MLHGFSQQEVELIQKLNPSLEGNRGKQKNPHPKESLAFATSVMTRLGSGEAINHTDLLKSKRFQEV